MPVTTPHALQDIVSDLTQATGEALKHRTVSDFVALERQLAEVEAQVREVQQSLWSREAKAAMGHLEGGSPLTPADIEVIRTLFISDAEHYVRLENNVPDWCRELERLIVDVARRVNTVDRTNIAELRAVLKDAQRLVPDIRQFLEEKARIERFEQGLASPDPSARKMMAKILREVIESPRR